MWKDKRKIEKDIKETAKTEGRLRPSQVRMGLFLRVKLGEFYRLDKIYTVVVRATFDNIIDLSTDTLIQRTVRMNYSLIQYSTCHILTYLLLSESPQNSNIT